MKKLLGAIAAAMVLGAGCAHERSSTTQTEARASAGTAGVTNGLTCEVINGNTAKVSSSAPVTSESSEAWGGSSSESMDQQQSGTGDSASQPAVQEGSAIGGSGSETDVSNKAPTKPLPVDDSASESNSFEDTDMGGTGGGGG